MLKEVTCLVLFFFFLLPTKNTFNFPLLTSSSTAIHHSDSDSYAVVFDAGSTGSRVHVFAFQPNLDLTPIHQSYEFFLSISPGLSSYEHDPDAAALSLKPLLQSAEAVVPAELRAQTPVRLGATAGLRLLPGNASEAILDAVRKLLKTESKLYYRPDWVSVLGGIDEGGGNQLFIGSLGKSYWSTVGIVDLGGGSVQMAYAISEAAAAAAPPTADGEDPYVSDKVALGTKYHLYAHSYLNYGLKAARALSLKLSGNKGNPCITNGYQGTYEYSDVVYKVSPPMYGTSRRRCRLLTRKVLGLDAPCSHRNCSFNGVWNGGGGDGRKNLYVASFFYDTAAETGIIEPNAPGANVRPIQYLKAAKRACTANVDNINSIFPLIDKRDVPFLCMDLVYEYMLLVDGFGVDPLQEITVLKEVNYKGSLIGAAWPLGCAVELVSSLK
ncbi:UNVERIFIED_CONTAM: Apyrase [Sesamum latifolium]|uniref:Apyrase n=1 Tax=Sesamum latifolium TaxID=2727402 RepID=A0AAW2WLC4_9LAMI